ncbi:MULTISPECIES: TIGR00366 family protein [Micrococcaceae]|uniref:short-chain fatty acid transporter n=1 Tax=Micrococcaceae TaxID=1268 RepID=UPI001612F157|nr:MULTISPECIES: TIGR00366 family protein [Micrococcaceae]HRO93780.1 TIGR00366 family protein [Citricoccus sp.]
MRPINNVVERFIPSALVFSIALTFIVAILALILTDTGPADLILYWGDGLAGLLSFITQMALILLLGHILANTGPVRRLLAFLGSIPSSPLMAYVFVFVVAAVASLITWGLGLVVGGLLAREVAYQGRERGMKLHFPMLVASGFAGFVVWHMGYSASGPLTAATEGSFLIEPLGGETLPITETVFSSWNMIAAVATILVVGLALFLVAPRPGDRIKELEIDAREQADDGQEEIVTPADRLDASRVVTLLLGLMLTAYLVLHFAQGGTLTLDTVNWSFLALILLLVRNPFELIALTKNAASNVGEILLQFPLYAGILGMMTGSGLIQVFSDAFVAISTPVTFGLLAFLSAGLVNFFVPSGGGQFAVQGPIMLSAGAELGVDPAITVMAVSYGDQWTNMVQPFWAIPLLAIAGLKMRDILGYTTVVLIASGLVFGGTLLLVSL